MEDKNCEGPARLSTHGYCMELEQKCWDIVHAIKNSPTQKTREAAFFLEGMASALHAVMRYEEIE